MAEFFNMGGYAFFVWTSYAVVAVLFTYQFLSSRAQHKKLISQLGAEVEHKIGRTNKS
jgi:heme exporter protein CcmD